MPGDKRTHLSYEGIVIGKDDEGVMLELAKIDGPMDPDSDKCCHLYAPYEMVSEEMIEMLEVGAILDIEIDIAQSGWRVDLVMKPHDADTPREQE